MSDEEESAERQIAAVGAIVNVHGGRCPGFADVPALKLCGPMWKIFDLQGNHIPHTHRTHPCGPKPGRKIIGWQECGIVVDGV